MNNRSWYSVRGRYVSTQLYVEQLEERTVPTFFNPFSAIGVHRNPHVIAVGQFNTNVDQIPDIIISEDETFEVLLGNPNGSYTSVLTYGLDGMVGEGIAVGDFNKDGRQDIAVACYSFDFSFSYIQVVLARGDGTFTDLSNEQTQLLFFAQDALFTYMATADINKDGNLDLVVSDFSQDRIWIYQGQGNGQFQPVADLTGNGLQGPEQIVLADLDLDGYLDLAVANLRPIPEVGSTVSFFRGTAQGSFQSASFTVIDSLLGIAGGSIGLVAADLDLDGRRDLAVANFGEFIGDSAFPSRTYTVLPNQSVPGNLSFGAPISFFAGQHLINIVAGDFNSDALPDLAFTSYSFDQGVQDHVMVVINQSPASGQFQFAAPIEMPVGDNPEGLFAHDLNGDGNSDLIVANSGSGTIGIAQGRGFTATRDTIGVVNPSTTWFLRNDASPGGADVHPPFNYGGGGWRPVTGDWDGDGVDSIGVVDPNNNWFLRDANSPGTPHIFPFNYGAPGWRVVTGDWDGDGIDTIGVVDPNNNWYLRNSNSPGGPDLPVFNYGAPGWRPIVGDWDGDGIDTIGVIDPNNNWYLRNSNSPGGPDLPVFNYGAPGWRPIVGDWNGDGIDTIGVVDPNNNWYLRNANTPGGPDVHAPFNFGAPGWIPVSGDWDGAPGEPLLAASVGNFSTDRLQSNQLLEIVAAAVSRIEAAGADANVLATVRSASFGIADLPGRLLGLAQSATAMVLIDPSAAGHGWFIDVTPFDDEEFADDGPRGMDLLSVVMHEFGHLLGHSDVDVAADPDDWMASELGAGRRRIPSSAQLVEFALRDDWWEVMAR